MKTQNSTNAIVENSLYQERASNPLFFQGYAEKIIHYLSDRFKLSVGRMREAQHSATFTNNEQGRVSSHSLMAIDSTTADEQEVIPPLPWVILSLVVEFSFNQVDLGDGYAEKLHHIAVFLNKNPEVIAIIEGHSANANEDAIQVIAQLRAQTVADFLIEKFSVSCHQLAVEGFGNSRRSADNIYLDTHQKSQQIHFILHYLQYN